MHYRIWLGVWYSDLATASFHLTHASWWSYLCTVHIYMKCWCMISWAYEKKSILIERREKKTFLRYLFLATNILIWSFWLQLAFNEQIIFIIVEIVWFVLFIPRFFILRVFTIWIKKNCPKPTRPRKKLVNPFRDFGSVTSKFSSEEQKKTNSNNIIFRLHWYTQLFN